MSAHPARPMLSGLPDHRSCPRTRRHPAPRVVAGAEVVAAVPVWRDAGACGERAAVVGADGQRGDLAHPGHVDGAVRVSLRVRSPSTRRASAYAARPAARSSGVRRRHWRNATQAEHHDAVDLGTATCRRCRAAASGRRPSRNGAPVDSARHAAAPPTAGAPARCRRPAPRGRSSCPMGCRSGMVVPAPAGDVAGALDRALKSRPAPGPSSLRAGRPG